MPSIVQNILNYTWHLYRILIIFRWIYLPTILQFTLIQAFPYGCFRVFYSHIVSHFFSSMTGKCCHSQVRATLFSSRCPLVCWRASCTPNRRRLSIPQYQFCPEWRTTTYVLTMIWSLIFR